MELPPHGGVNGQWHASVDRERENGTAAAMYGIALNNRPSCSVGSSEIGNGRPMAHRTSALEELGGRCFAAVARSTEGVCGEGNALSKQSTKSADAERSLAVLTEQLRVSLDLAAGGDGSKQVAVGQLADCRVGIERRPVHIDGGGTGSAMGAAVSGRKVEIRGAAMTGPKLDRATAHPLHADALGEWPSAPSSPHADHQQARHRAELMTTDECPVCHKVIRNKTDACAAMGRNYHTRCFTCFACGRVLKGKPFYWLQDKAYCEEDYKYTGFQQMAEHCRACGQLIQDVVLQAVGQPYHPGCFRCQVCNKCLDGESFTVDERGSPLCIGDYHRLHAPICASCKTAILPMQGTDETVRVVALGNDYHIDCYHCADCGIQLTDEPQQRCYPLGSTLLCRTCHVARRDLPHSAIGGGSNGIAAESVAGRPNDAYASDSKA